MMQARAQRSALIPRYAFVAKIDNSFSAMLKASLDHKLYFLTGSTSF